jgi:hypothetical protein
MFVVTVGVAGNVKPKFTTAVADTAEANVIEMEPRRLQFVKFVIDAAVATSTASSAAMSAAWFATVLSREANAASTCTARIGEEVVGPPVRVTPGSELGDS